MLKKKRKGIAILFVFACILLWQPYQSAEKETKAKAEIQIVNPKQTAEKAFREIEIEKREDGISGVAPVKTDDLTPIVGMLCLALCSLLLAAVEVLRRMRF